MKCCNDGLLTRLHCGDQAKEGRGGAAGAASGGGGAAGGGGGGGGVRNSADSRLVLCVSFSCPVFCWIFTYGLFWNDFTLGILLLFLVFCCCFWRTGALIRKMLASPEFFFNPHK